MIADAIRRAVNLYADRHQRMPAQIVLTPRLYRAWRNEGAASLRPTVTISDAPCDCFAGIPIRCSERATDVGLR